MGGNFEDTLYDKNVKQLLKSWLNKGTDVVQQKAKDKLHNSGLTGSGKHLFKSKAKKRTSSSPSITSKEVKEWNVYSDSYRFCSPQIVGMYKKWVGPSHNSEHTDKSGERQMDWPSTCFWDHT